MNITKLLMNMEKDDYDSILIAGPTAGGKSSFSKILMQQLYEKHIKAVLINADSQQVYNALHILTAQPDPIQSFPQVLYGYKAPHDEMSVHIWLNDLKTILDKFQNSVPVLIGGTGLYLKAAIDGVSLLPARSDTKYDELSLEECYAILKEKDPEALLYIKDKRRIIRALDIYDQTGIKYTERYLHHSKPLIKKPYKIYIDNAQLEANILKRLSKDINKMIDEVESQAKNILGSKLEKAIGFHAIMSFLSQSHTNLDQAKNDLIVEIYHQTRQYAKRQRTWFKKYYSFDMCFESDLAFELDMVFESDIALKDYVFE